MADVILPSKKLAGKAKAKRPGSDLKKGEALQNSLSQYTANAIASVRTRTDVNDIIRTLMREDGLFSSAANSMTALATGSGFRIAGYNASGAMDSGVMSIAYSLLDSLTALHDYSKGYNDKPGIMQLLATLQQDVVGTGGTGVELVLGKDFFPERLVPVGYSTITWVSDGQGGRFPAQDGGDTSLNLPTVFIAEHNRNADEGYSVSLLRPGLSNTVAFNEFIEDTHRAVNRTGHSRLIASLNAERVWAAAPDDVKNDPDKRNAYFNAVKAGVEGALEGLEPEDALVSYDTVTYDVKDIGGSKSDYSNLLATLGNLLGASLKTPASVTGLRASGGQGLSNAETMVYLKIVEASRNTVEEVISRALTLAVRLAGIDGYVNFEFLPINLRPEEELEAYKGTKQARVLALLSYGIINDAEACFELGIRPQGLSKVFSGTGFYENAPQAATAPVDRTSSVGAALNPGTPAKSGGSSK